MKKDIEEPDVEKIIRGSHDGFTEILSTNVAIIRRRIKNTKLKFKSFNIGTVTNQSVSIAYLEGIANPELLNKLYEKIKAIDFDGLLAIGYIEQMITDFPYSLFPQYLSTERPDKAVAALLEGRLVVLLDGTPVVLIAPVSFFSFFQTMDDFSNNWIFGSFWGMLRFIGALLAIFLPSLYIAITSFHYYTVPLELLVTLAESRAKVPFPPIVEALMIELTLEMIREAAIRLPSYIGTTIGVIGGIVIGQTATQAGIVSNMFLIIVAITTIASFTIPTADMVTAVRLTRFGFMIMSSIFGMVGIIISAALLFAHLMVIESLEQPYFQPISPFKFEGLKNTIIRLPIKFLKNRPDISKPNDKIRGRKNG